MILTRRSNLAVHVSTLYSAATPPSDWRPDDLIGTYITFPIASLANHNFTSVVAAASTGDARQVALSICSRFVEWYNNLSTQPQAMEVVYTPRRALSSSDFPTNPKHEYKFTFYEVFPDLTIADEPV